MDIAESIKAAWAAVEDSGVPEHMQELAFREALRALLQTAPSAPPHAKQRTSSVDNGPKPMLDEAGGTAATVVEEATVIAAVAEHTGASAEKLEKLFHIDNGTVKLVVNQNALGRSGADKTRAAAQVITIVRKIGMGHADTSFAVIREECERKHIYVAKNFTSKHLPEIDGFVVKGEGRNKRLEARTSGISAFPALMKKILDDS